MQQPQGTQHGTQAKTSLLLLPVCRPCDRPPGPVWGVPGPPVPGIVCVSPGLLCQGPQPPGKGPEKNPHLGQLTCILHLPPRECCEWSQGPKASGWDRGFTRVHHPSVAQQPPVVLARKGKIRLTSPFPTPGACAVLV